MNAIVKCLQYGMALNFKSTKFDKIYKMGKNNIRISSVSLESWNPTILMKDRSKDKLYTMTCDFLTERVYFIWRILQSVNILLRL